MFLGSGVLMPAAKIDDGAWLLDSVRILGELGFSKVDEADSGALQTLFGGGALQPTDSAWEFWQRWSFVRDEDSSLLCRLWNHLWRSFSFFHLFRVITIARFRFPQPSDEQLLEGFAYRERLGAAVLPALACGGLVLRDTRHDERASLAGACPAPEGAN